MPAQVAGGREGHREWTLHGPVLGVAAKADEVVVVLKWGDKVRRHAANDPGKIHSSIWGWNNHTY